MKINRRTILKSSGIALSGSLMVGTPLKGLKLNSSTHLSDLDANDERIKKLAKIAVDSAISAGASYADVRLTYSKAFIMWPKKDIPDRDELIGIGIRALVNGYWGFASSPVWSENEAARLGKGATANAKVNILSELEPSEHGILGSDEGGSWIMPVLYDPFEMAVAEIADHLEGIKSYIQSLPMVDPGRFRIESLFKSQDKYFYSSSNRFAFQRLFNTSGTIIFRVADRMGAATASLDILTPAGVGFELFKNKSLRDIILQAHSDAVEELSLPFQPIDVGRYEVLFNRRIVAPLISQSIGTATELDRVFGYEANAGGTSYITEPEEMIGSLQLTDAKISVISDRSADGSVNKVKWDDEGMAPRKVTVVKDGKLVALQGSNDGFSLLKSHYQKSGGSFVPTGGMVSESGIESPLLHTSDLHIEVGDSGIKMDDIRSNIKSGLEVRSGGVMLDFQKSTGYGTGGTVFQIENGKRVARVVNMGYLFRTQQLWKNVTALGHQSEVGRFGCALEKGEPRQESYHTVYSPHLLIKDVDVIDSTRKA